MTHITAIASLEDFANEIREGYIRSQVHPDPNVPFIIYNYAEKTVFERRWNPVTVASRGLIVNSETGEIIARPFRKFWNNGETIPGWNDFAREGKVEVFDKADGSLGILYFLPDGSPAIATRGSMGSDQAVHATAIFRAKYGDFKGRDDLTYLAEIIFPTNRIVLDYGNMDDLILLGAVSKETGRSVDFDVAREGWSGPVVEKFTFSSYLEVLAAEVPVDREGFVIRFVDTDKRVKIKGSDYLRLHRIITGVTPRRVWEVMAAGQSLDEWLASGVPEEFENWIRKTQAEIQAQHDDLLARVQASYQEVLADLPEGYNQKDFALRVQQVPQKDDQGLIFSLHTGRDDRLAETIWKRIRPESTTPMWAGDAEG